MLSVQSAALMIVREPISTPAHGVDELRKALTAAGLPETAVEDCCAVDTLDLVGRGGLGCLAKVGVFGGRWGGP